MKLVVCFCLVSFLVTGCQSVVRRSSFPAGDKKQHYDVGYALGQFSLPVLPLGLLLAITAGGGKECYDCISPGNAEWQDFEYTSEGGWDGYRRTWTSEFYGLD